MCYETYDNITGHFSTFGTKGLCRRHFLPSFCSSLIIPLFDPFQDYTYYFVPAPWLSVKLLRLLQNYPPPEDPGVRGRLNECLETILNKAQVRRNGKKRYIVKTRY